MQSIEFASSDRFRVDFKVKMHRILASELPDAHVIGESPLDRDEFEGAMDIEVHPATTAATQSTRHSRRRQSMSAHGSPMRRAADLAREGCSPPPPLPHSPVGRHRGGSGGSRLGLSHLRSASSTLSLSSITSTGSCSVASFACDSVAPGSLCLSPTDAYSEPEPEPDHELTHTTLTFPATDDDAMDEGDALVSDMRASMRITNGSSVDTSLQSSRTTSPGLRGAAYSPSHSRSRISRKRRNSRLHAAVPLHPQVEAHSTPVEPTTTQRAAITASSSSVAVPVPLSTTAVAHYPPNKRQHSAPNAIVPQPHHADGASITDKLPAVTSQSAETMAVDHEGKATRIPAKVVTAPAPAPAPVVVASEQQQPAPAVAVVTASSSHHRSIPQSKHRSALISVLSCVLEQLFSNPADTLPSDPRCISMFHTSAIPSITIGQYLDRLAYYSECSDESLVMSFIHISRIYHSNQQASAAGGQARTFQLNTLSIHRLLLVCMMSSAKFWDDAYYNNSFWAKLGGVNLRELNALEVEFLALIAFELYIPAKIYRRFYHELTNAALHPHCQCAFRALPPLDFEESLPASPAHDCDLADLYEDGVVPAGLGLGSIRPMPALMPSPIAELTSVHLDQEEVKQQ